MRGKSVFNLFFEASTRTRTTFEIAASGSRPMVINLNVAVSSQSKGESLLDPWPTCPRCRPTWFVVRHGSSGAPYLIARHVKPHEHVIMPATVGMRTRPRDCSISTPSATTRRTSRA